VWKALRIAVLLVLLVVIAGGALLDRLDTTDWNRPLWVGVFPIAADGSDAAQRYVSALRADSFSDIDAFFAAEGREHGLRLSEPIRIVLYPEPAEQPPLLAAGSGPLATAWWSLKLRVYAARHGKSDGRAPPRIRVFVLYHDPARSPEVPHSLGLQKGLVGVVHAFADRAMSGSNNVVIAHELLHTLGATDKYDPSTGAPLYPDGYAEPEREPRHPQRLAEIMAGRIALGPGEHLIPESLRDAVVGEATAREIRWTRK
jgi:hypothetical protein